MDHPTLRERNKQKVTERIVAVAVQLFKTKGYHQTTMDDIAQAAEISRATLFNYFPAKDALLLPWGQEILDRHIHPALMAYLSAEPSTAEVLRYLLTSMSGDILASPDVVQAFMREALKPHNEPQRIKLGTGSQEIFVQVLSYGQERNEVRTDIPLEDLAHYLTVLYTSLLFYLMAMAPPEESLQRIAWLLAFVEAGITPRPLPGT